MRTALLILVAFTPGILAGQTGRILVKQTNKFVEIETDAVKAQIRKRGYVSGVFQGTFVDKKTGGKDLGFGLHFMDIKEMEKVYDRFKGTTMVSVKNGEIVREDKDKPLTPVEARKQIGKEITVEMEVKAAKDRLEKRGEIYLDSEENFRDEKDFAVVINKKGAASLNAAGIDNPADHFKGKTIRAKGKVKEVDGVPRIEIEDAKQIWIPEKK